MPGDVGFFAIGTDFLAVDASCPVLAAHGIGRADLVNGTQQFRLLLAHGVGVEGHRRLHRRHRDQLEKVVRHHVTKRARRIVKFAALLDADRFRYRDLHVVDAIPVPNGLEEAVRESERHDVLHRFLAEKVIDAENLVFVQILEHAVVQGLCGLQIVSKRFFDHDPPPAAVLVGQARGSKRFHQRTEETVRNGKIKQRTAVQLFVSVALVEMCFQLCESLGIGEIA